MTRIVRSLACFAVCLSASAAFAVDPVAKITGKTSAKQGDLLVLDSGDTTPPEAKRKWIVWPQLEGTTAEVKEKQEQQAADLRAAGWKLEPPKDSEDGYSMTMTGGNKLHLATHPGRYLVVLSVGTADGGFDSVKWEVIVLGACPKPPYIPPPDDDDPPPPPPDDPPPPPPPGVTNVYDLAAACRLWLVQIPNETLPERPAMRKIFSTIGQGALDGKYATMTDVEKGLGKTVNDANANKIVTKPAWDSWGKSAQAALAGLQAAGEIKTPQDYGQALIEIAEGLK